MSKVVQLALINSIPTSTMKELNKIQKKLFGRTTPHLPPQHPPAPPQKKHTTLCNNYNNGSLKMSIYHQKYPPCNVPGLRN